MPRQNIEAPGGFAMVPRDPHFRKRVQESFGRQTVMTTMGISLIDVAPGRVTLSMAFSDACTQQHGFIHAGVTTTALDSACAYAAFTLMDRDAAVLTVEFKTNLVAPAKGDTFIYEGMVLKPGRTLSVCEGRAYAGGRPSQLVASMTATIMAVRDRPELSL